LVALAAELLDGHVTRGVDLGPRDHPGGPVLVPYPHVLHAKVEERIAGLRDVLEVELVAEIGRVLGEHAVAEQPEDRRVLLLECELELRLELVELVDVGHEAVILALRAKPTLGRGPARRGWDRAPRAARGRTAAHAGAGAESRARPHLSSRRRRGAGRGRSCAARNEDPRHGCGRDRARSRASGRAALGVTASSPVWPPH